MLGEYSDALVIMCIVMINAVLGFIQEYRAEKSLEALKELSAPTAVVIRDGVRKKVPAGELVPGDLVVIEAGDLIPADIRLGEAKQLAVNEAALTGESEPVNKDPDTLYENATTLGDRLNMLYSGTMAVSGRGSGIVVATGMETELGKIAHMIQEAEEKKPSAKKTGPDGQVSGGVLSFNLRSGCSYGACQGHAGLPDADGRRILGCCRHPGGAACRGNNCPGHWCTKNG